MPPVTRTTVRARGVRWIDAPCEVVVCGHHAAINADARSDDLLVQVVSPRLRCSRCSSRSIILPNRAERGAAGTGRDYAQRLLTRVSEREETDRTS
jgi:hypothetical protein